MLSSVDAPDRGSLTERPWAVTLAAFGLRGRTGELVVRAADGKRYAIAFARGAVVGATSPVTADAVARIAQSERLVTSRYLELARLRRSTRRDELEGFVEDARLAPDQVERLKRRVLLQRAGRTFAIAEGEFQFTERIAIPILRGAEIDVRAIVYEGARKNLDGDRLAADLRSFGPRFVLAADAAELARFELDDSAQPLLAALRLGTSLPELEASHRDLDPRMMQAVLYALAACGAVTRAEPSSSTISVTLDTPATSLPRVPTPREPTISRVPTTPRAPTVSRVPSTPRAPTMSCVPMLIRSDPEVSEVRSFPRGTGAPRAPTEPFLEARATAVRPNALSAREIRALIAERSELLDRGADHFTLLGLPIGASVEAVRTAYVELARYLRPERLAQLQLRDRGFRARTLFAQLCIAYTVLTDPARRAEYLTGLRRRGVIVDFERIAAEAFARGERALRAGEPELAIAELRTACALDPGADRYRATLERAEARLARG